MTDPTKLQVIPSQENFSVQLQDALIAEIMQPKYDHMHVATLLGVLALVNDWVLRRAK